MARKNTNIREKLPNDLKTRAAIDSTQCIQVAGMKLHENKETLVNRRVSVKFFDAVIAPAVLFGSTTTPLTMTQLLRII